MWLEITTWDPPSSLVSRRARRPSQAPLAHTLHRHVQGLVNRGSGLIPKKRQEKPPFIASNWVQHTFFGHAAQNTIYIHFTCAKNFAIVTRNLLQKSISCHNREIFRVSVYPHLVGPCNPTPLSGVAARLWQFLSQSLPSRPFWAHLPPFSCHNPRTIPLLLRICYTSRCMCNNILSDFRT